MREYFIDGIPYVSKEQFCKLAHVRKANALKLIQSGLIPYIDIGDQTHRYLIRQSDAEAYLTDRAHDPAKYSFQRESRIQTYPGKFDRNFANELSQYASVLWSVQQYKCRMYGKGSISWLGRLYRGKRYQE